MHCLKIQKQFEENLKVTAKRGQLPKKKENLRLLLFLSCGWEKNIV